MTAAVPDAAWLAAQRWFRSKQRPIAGVREVDRAAVSPSAELVVVEVTYRDGGAPDRYLLPLSGRSEPADGDGLWRALAGAMLRGTELRGATGAFIATPTRVSGPIPGGDEAVAGSDERRLAVEQSNTSVVLGDRLILKLYRLLEPGINPDLEVGSFLTDAGFADTPAMAGSLVHVRHDGQAAAAAMLQAFVPSRGDAWSAMLELLATDPDAAIGLARDIGAVTAALHAALASQPEHPGFPARPATDAEAGAWRASAERELDAAIGAVAGTERMRLVTLAPRLRASLTDSFAAAVGAARVSRIHGDYHLGQLLARDDGGLSVIDFEGEPARPLAERRLPGSPLRDVAGMLRSLDYAVRTAAVQGPAAGFDAEAWPLEARAAFLDAYGKIDEAERHLLNAFELEKACYEVRYESANRPAWLWLPLAGIERLSDGGLPPG